MAAMSAWAARPASERVFIPRQQRLRDEPGRVDHHEPRERNQYGHVSELRTEHAAVVIGAVNPAGAHANFLE